MWEDLSGSLRGCGWPEVLGEGGAGGLAGLCGCNIRAIIPCALGVSPWLGPLVNRPGVAVLCVLSKQMFGVGVFLAVYFFL